MFSKILFIFLASLSLFCTAEEHASTFLDEINKAYSTFQTTVEGLAGELSKVVEKLPGHEIVEAVKVQAKNFADQAEQVQQQLDKELKSLTNSTVVERYSDFNKKILETVSTFRSQIESSPITDKALELHGKFQEGINNLLAESKKLATGLEPQVVQVGTEIEKLAKKVVTEAVENFSQLQEKLQPTTAHGAPKPSN